MTKKNEFRVSLPENITGNETFVLQDSEGKMTIAVRDFFGIHPLYYTTIEGERRFASSVKELLHFWLEKKNRLPAINTNRVVDYFDTSKTHAVIDNETFFEGIYRFLPAHLMIYEDGKEISYKPYKQIDIEKYKGITDEEAPKKFRELLVASVKRNIEGYKTIGTHVSGGLDSSSIASVAQSLVQEPIYTFHLNPEIEKANEQHYAELVHQKWQTNHTVYTSPTTFYESMDGVIRQCALPDSVNLPITFFGPMLTICREKGIEIIPSGHCGDQVVGYGVEYLTELYRQHDWQELKIAIKKWIPDADKVKKFATVFLLKKLKNEFSISAFFRTGWVLVRYFGVWGKEVFELLRARYSRNEEIKWSRELLKNKLIKPNSEAKSLDVKALVNSSLSPQQEKQMKSFYERIGIEYFELSSQYYAHHGSRPNGTKVCTPFLDQELIALNLNVSNKLRFGDGKLRGTIRQAMADYLPQEIAQRTTKGMFNEYGIRAFKEMYATFRQKNEANYDSLPVWDYIDQHAFENLAQKGLTDQDIAFPILLMTTRVIYFNMWLQFLEDFKKQPSVAA